MVRFKFLILIFLLIVSSLKAQSYPDSNIDYLVKAGIWNILVNNYSEAERDFTILENYYPDNPLTYLTLGILEVARKGDADHEWDKAKLEKYKERANHLADSLLDHERSDWNYFLSGASSGLATLSNYLSKDYFSLIFDGLSSLDNFSECLRLNPKFYAANVAFGAYRYWKSDALLAYDWLPFVSDEREQGRKQLLEGVSGYSYLQSFGMESLIWMSIHEKKYELAIKYAESQLKIYPDSRLFLWALAHALQTDHKRKALVTFYKILNLFEKDSISNNVKFIQIMHKTAMLHQSLGELEQALSNCEKALSVENLTSYEESLVNDRLKKLEQMKKNLVELLKRK